MSVAVYPDAIRAVCILVAPNPPCASVQHPELNRNTPSKPIASQGHLLYRTSWPPHFSSLDHFWIESYLPSARLPAYNAVTYRHNLRRGDLVGLVISSSILRHSDGSIARAAGAHRRRTTARRSAVLLRRSGGSADPVVLAVLVRLPLLGGHAGHSARSGTCRARRSRRAVTTCSTEMRLGHLHRTEAGALAGVSRRGGRGWSARKTLRTVAFRRGGCGARVLRHLGRLGSGRHAGRVERLDGVGSRIRKVNRGVVLRAGRVELGSAGFECSVNEEAMTTHHAVIKVVSVRPPALSEEEP